MSRRDYSEVRYDERDSEIYRRPRRYRDDDDFELDVTRARYAEPRRAETIVRERERDRDTVLSKARTERSSRLPEFLREDYGKSATSGALVIKDEKIQEDSYSHAPTRRRSIETVRGSKPPADARSERVDQEEIIIRERDRDRGRGRGLPYPQSERSSEEEEFIFRERTRSRPAPERRHDNEEEINIQIERSKEETRSQAPPRSEAGRSQAASRSGRSEFRERDREEIEEIRFRRGTTETPRPPPPRSEVDKEEIIIREERREGPRERVRERDFREEIDIRERSQPPPARRRSVNRGYLVARENEEWIVRRPRSPPRPQPREYEREEIVIRRKERSPSPEPPPPPAPRAEVEKEEIIIKRTERSASPPPRPASRNVEKEEIIIRRKERSASPEQRPPSRNVQEEQIIIRRKERSPSPEPPRSPSPPPMEPIIRPPIIQEYITHHRHIDHGFERARSPSPPPPAPPSPPREENLEIEIKRKGVRNGKAYDDEIIIDEKRSESRPRAVSRAPSRQRSMSMSTRRKSPSPVRRRYDDEVAIEADYYNRRAASRGYPGEAYGGVTKDWGLVDIPPGTERVRMDGVGGGRQEISWGRYNGARRSKFIADDRVYESEMDAVVAVPPPAPAPPQREERVEETKIRITEERSRSKVRDKMWTEITKDLVIKEAIIEKGYEFEENADFYYVMEYLQYEDVLKLVELTEDIRRQRRERIRELQWQREEIERLPKLLPPPPPAPVPQRSKYDQRIYERDYYYDREKRMYR